MTRFLHASGREKAVRVRHRSEQAGIRDTDHRGVRHALCVLGFQFSLVVESATLPQVAALVGEFLTSLRQLAPAHVAIRAQDIDKGTGLLRPVCKHCTRNVNATGTVIEAWGTEKEARGYSWPSSQSSPCPGHSAAA